MFYMKRLADYSQNFLKSPQLVHELIDKTNLSSSDLVYDIGAGSGVITSALASRVRKVVAIEVEPRISERLKENTGSLPNVTVLQKDFLTVPLPTEEFKIFANIPFHLSSPILKRFINNPNAPSAAYLIVQKQFGEKLLSSEVGRFTAQLGMLIGVEYSVKIIRKMQKTDYQPMPAIDTVFIELLKRGDPLVPKDRLKAYGIYTTECFADPKKLAKLPLHIIGKTPGFPPSRLTLAQWIILFNSQNVY